MGLYGTFQSGWDTEMSTSESSEKTTRTAYWLAPSWVMYAVVGVERLSVRSHQAGKMQAEGWTFPAGEQHVVDTECG